MIDRQRAPPPQRKILDPPLIRDMTDSTFENTKIKYMRGATVEMIQDGISNCNVSAYENVIIHVDTNDISYEYDMDKIMKQFENLVTNFKLKSPQTKLIISVPCPRQDEHSALDIQLSDLMQKLECRYIQNSTSFKYVDGEVDRSSLLKTFV
ncbi:hypothetical protein HOLleu_30987 [Holothuria leucospilota]|uniref:Uncharacterized protein n=1 Tax=Holothuria leucospilota TaxID=206669 RepID=A0A9Q1GZP6_HOLLE|nr:hypothetical protein HOLleu_30987 [Holothuria leucospilota]